MESHNPDTTSAEPEISAPHDTLDETRTSTAGDKFARSLWVGYTLITSGITGAMAIGLVVWGFQIDQHKLIWTGSILFALVLLAWATLTALLTFWIFLDLTRYAKRIFDRSKLTNRSKASPPTTNAKCR